MYLIKIDYCSLWIQSFLCCVSKRRDSISIHDLFVRFSLLRLSLPLRASYCLWFNNIYRELSQIMFATITYFGINVFISMEVAQIIPRRGGKEVSLLGSEARKQFSQHKSRQLCFNPDWLLNKHWNERARGKNGEKRSNNLIHECSVFMWKKFNKKINIVSRLSFFCARDEFIFLPLYMSASLMLLILSIEKSKIYGKWRSDGKGHDCCNYN